MSIKVSDLVNQGLLDFEIKLATGTVGLDYKVIELGIGDIGFSSKTLILESKDNNEGMV